MREDLEKLVAVGMLESQYVEPLALLVKHEYCFHRSWGYGRITTVDAVAGRMLIDFDGKTSHGMSLTFAAQSLKAIPKDHVIARKMSDIGNLRQMAALHHLDLIKLVIQSFEGQATLEQIQKVLVPDVIADDWKKWWEVARREMKKDGRFQIPTKKTDPIVFSAEGASIQDRLLEDFRAAKGLKAKLHVAAEIEKNSAELGDKVGAGNTVVAALNADIVSHQRTMSPLALEAIFVRNEIRKLTGAAAQPGELDAIDIWTQGAKLGEILENLPASRHRAALESYKSANPNLWSDGVFGLLNSTSTKVAGELAEMLSDEGQFTQLKEHLQRLISQHQASSELLLWLARERADQYADILGPEVFRAMLTAIERDQFNERKSNKLRDYIFNEQSLIIDLIGTADIEVIKDLTRALQLSPVFDDMDKRSLLARIVKNYPAVQSLISGEQSKQDSSLIVSWESLQRRKLEYEDLVKIKVPANSKEIALARSYGDLRENHEYKAAKEMQKVLMHRKSELERDLGRARGTDFANPRLDIISIGTHVKLTETAGGAGEEFTILGAWDGDPDKQIISYLTPVGQALLNQPLHGEVDVEMDAVTKRYRVDSIAPASLPPVPHSEEASAQPA